MASWLSIVRSARPAMAARHVDGALSISTGAVGTAVTSSSNPLASSMSSEVLMVVMDLCVRVFVVWYYAVSRASAAVSVVWSGLCCLCSSGVGVARLGSFGAFACLG